MKVWKWMQLESSSNKKHIACCVMTCNDLQWHVQIFELFLYSCMLVTKCTTLWDDVNPYVLHNQYQTEYLDCISFQVNVFLSKMNFFRKVSLDSWHSSFIAAAKGHAKHKQFTRFWNCWGPERIKSKIVLSDLIRCFICISCFISLNIDIQEDMLNKSFSLFDRYINGVYLRKQFVFNKLWLDVATMVMAQARAVT